MIDKILIIFFYTSTLVSGIFSHDLNVYNKQNQFKFQGLMAPVFTPFRNDINRTLNLEIIPKYAEFLASKNITGILVAGTTGEGTSLTIDERKKLTEAWSRATKKTKQHLMVHIGGVALVEIKNLAAHAEKFNVSSLLCLPDLYFKPNTVQELIEYLKEIGESAPRTPLLYYHSTKVKINVNVQEFVKHVGKSIPTLVGMKIDSADVKEAMDVLQIKDSLKIIYGNKMIMSAGCAIGLNSFMSATLNFIPQFSFRILEFCKNKIDLKKVQELQNSLFEIEKTILMHGGYIEAMKTSMSILTGIDVGPTRSPIKTLSQDSVNNMTKCLKNMNLL